jgi:hypothetical protein
MALYWWKIPLKFNGELFLSSRLALGPIQPPIQQVQHALCLAGKQMESEADHSLPTSAKAKKTWVYTSSPPPPPTHIFIL